MKKYKGLEMRSISGIRSLIKINIPELKQFVKDFGGHILLLIIIFIQLQTNIQLIDKLNSLDNTFIADSLEKKISDVESGVAGQIYSSANEIKDEIDKHKVDLCTYGDPCHVIIDR